MECAEQQQYVLRLLAQDTGSAVNGQQVGCIEASDKLHVHFAVIDVHQHAVKSILKNFALEVAKRSERIGVYFCLCILNHDHTVSVIGICQGESRFRQSVEECLFCLQVVFECFVIVQMVAGDVREDASGEPQPSDTFLGYRVRADFHEGIFAAFICHASQQFVQRDRVRSRMVGGYGFSVDIIAYRGDKSDLIAEFSEHII